MTGVFLEACDSGVDPRVSFFPHFNVVLLVSVVVLVSEFVIVVPVVLLVFIKFP